MAYLSRSVPPPNVQQRMSRAWCVGSCLRKNDGWGYGVAAETGAGFCAGHGEIPAASAGMTGLEGCGHQSNRCLACATSGGGRSTRRSAK